MHFTLSDKGISNPEHLILGDYSVDGAIIRRKLLTIQILRDKKCGVSNSGLAATSNPVSQVLW